jgi:predicted HAD superfamily Cof-like phosphohydrolase
MRHLVDDVRQVHAAAGIQFPTTPSVQSPEDLTLSARLVVEETWEVLEALYQGRIPGRDIRQAVDLILQTLKDYPPDPPDLAHLAKEIIDGIVVLVRMGAALGLPMQACWDEVHRSNMAKFPNGVATFREDGKIQKPEGWQPPDMQAVLDRWNQESGSLNNPALLAGEAGQFSEPFGWVISQPPNGLLCLSCHQPQVQTASGTNCPNNHWGIEGYRPAKFPPSVPPPSKPLAGFSAYEDIGV